MAVGDRGKPVQRIDQRHCDEQCLRFVQGAPDDIYTRLVSRLPDRTKAMKLARSAPRGHLRVVVRSVDRESLFGSLPDVEDGLVERIDQHLDVVGAQALSYLQRWIR